MNPHPPSGASDQITLREYMETRLICISELIAANTKNALNAAAMVKIELDSVRDKLNDLRVQAAVTAALVSLAISIVVGLFLRQ